MLQQKVHFEWFSKLVRLADPTRQSAISNCCYLCKWQMQSTNIVHTSNWNWLNWTFPNWFCSIATEFRLLNWQPNVWKCVKMSIIRVRWNAWLINDKIRYRRAVFSFSPIIIQVLAKFERNRIEKCKPWSSQNHNVRSSCVWHFIFGWRPYLSTHLPLLVWQSPPCSAFHS